MPVATCVKDEEVVPPLAWSENGEHEDMGVVLLYHVTVSPGFDAPEETVAVNVVV